MSDARTLPYRCLIPGDDCRAIIKVGSSKIECQLVDVSREDFHVRLTKQWVKKLRNARHIELHYHDERWLVSVDAHDKSNSDTIYLHRVRELTKVKTPSPWASFDRLKLSEQTDPRFMLALMVAFVFASLALPGLGDKVGTAPRFKKGIHYVIDYVKDTANR